MGTRSENRTPAAWQGTLEQMRRHGTRLAQTCITKDCRRWAPLHIDELIEDHGPDLMLWDRRWPCPACGGKTHFMASPGPSTPFRPLLTGNLADQVKREFLKTFGFTKRDVLRIQRMAAATASDREPREMNDLDVPFRIGSCWPGHEGYSTGRILGESHGSTLLYWEMNSAEADQWRRSRRTGPKPIPG